MFKAELIQTENVFDAIRDGIEKAPDQFKVLFVQKTRPITDGVLNQLRQEPGPVKYPVDWTSERQRRAFYATNGFGRGIPTKRTGKYLRSWQAGFEVQGGVSEFVIENTDPKAQFVGGIYQQRFHRQTGWVYAPDVVIDASIAYENASLEAWYEAVEFAL